MRRMLVALCLLLFGCTGVPVDTHYKGADGGVLIFSVGYVGQPFNMDFLYKKAGTPSARGEGVHGRIHYNASLLLRTPNDYEGPESGAVRVVHLAPGEYEVYTWEISSYGPFVASVYWPKKEFSFRFTIRPGKATYIGTYEYVPSFGNANGYPFRFLVADRQARDLPIARNQEPDLPPVTIAVPDVASIPGFVSAPPSSAL